MRHRVLPVLYVSHGFPMVAIEPDWAGEQMQKIGEYLQTLPIQVSIPWPMTPNDAEKFGQALQPLRRQGVLIVTSGSQTHNLRDVAYGQPAHAYIEPFVSWMRNVMMRRDLEALKNYRTLVPNAIRAHPTEEHFMPMLIALAASENGDSVSLYDGGVAYSALSMDAYLFECTSETKG